MPATFPVQFLAADRPFYEGECVSLVLPTITGMYGIMAHHRNMITAIIPGMMRYQLPGEPEQMAAVSAGLVKVENGEVLILVDSAERPEEIDRARAEAARERAEERLRQKLSMRDYYNSKAALARALARLKAAKRH